MASYRLSPALRHTHAIGKDKMRVVIPIAIIAGCGVAIGILWLWFGRRISRVIDWCFPGRPSPQPIDPLLIKADCFVIGSCRWPLPRSEEFDLKFTTDRQGRLILHADGRAFTFGPVQKMWNDPIHPQFQFLPETGDRVSFTRDISRFPWPTPFTISFMGAPMPKWKRYAYDRLCWIKPGGAKLEITWSDEYWFYRRSGWADIYINRLKNITICLSPIEKFIAKYLRATKGWSGDEYRLEHQSATSEEDVIAAIYLKDEAAAHPGAASSVVLRVNRLSKKVVSETGWQ
jgi:hypothetical protein